MDGAMNRSKIPYASLLLLLSCLSVPRAESVPSHDPYELRRTALGMTDSLQFQRFLLNAGIIDSSCLHFSFDGEGSGSISRCRSHIDIFKANLFGDTAAERVMQYRYGGMIYAVSFYHLDASRWCRVPGLISFNQDDVNQAPCLDTPPCPGYFCFGFEQLRRAGEMALVGRVYGGNCQGVGRGDHTTFHVWQVTADGVVELFSGTEKRYAYSSPCPAPTAHEENAFRFREPDIAPYPKQLEIIEHRFREVCPDADSTIDDEQRRCFCGDSLVGTTARRAVLEYR